MDPLGMAEGVSTLLRTTEFLIDYIGGIQNATKDQLCLKIETLNLHHLLTDLLVRVVLSTIEDPRFVSIRSLTQDYGLIEQLRADLKQLQKKTSAGNGQNNHVKILPVKPLVSLERNTLTAFSIRSNIKHIAQTWCRSVVSVTNPVGHQLSEKLKKHGNIGNQRNDDRYKGGH